MMHGLHIPPAYNKKVIARIKMKDMDFDILEITSERQGNVNYNYFQTKIVATTSNDNYMKLGNWAEKSFSTHVSNYKVDLNFNGLIIAGIYPIDYSFTQYDIEVIFSVDYINGDMKLLRLKQLRKENLEKINNLS